MKKILLTLSSALLLSAPSFALAAFTTPESLITSIQQNSVRSVVTTVHGNSRGTYVSVWANGASKGAGQDMTLRTNATVDVSAGDATLRAKAEVMMQNGNAYLKINTLQGALQNVFANFSLSGYQKQWLAFPFVGSSSLPVSTDVTIDLGSLNPALANSMFVLDRQMTKGQNVYTLHLTPDYASELTPKIMTLLSETEVPSIDFFPWRNLAESLQYTLVIRTNAKDQFVSSTLSMKFAGKNSGLEITTNEKSVNNFSLSLPTNAMHFDDVFSLISSSLMRSDIAPMEDASASPASEETSLPAQTQSDTLDLACRDESLTPSAIMSLRRSGVCPVEKTSTRARGW